jgi:hypothetical protein
VRESDKQRSAPLVDAVHVVDVDAEHWPAGPLRFVSGRDTFCDLQTANEVSFCDSQRRSETLRAFRL